MTSKFKIEYYHKMPQSTSPYLQLLEAKKKIFGYKYDIIKSEKERTHSHHHNHNKSTGHNPSYKHSKTESHEKTRNKMGSRKKRSHTQQAQERLHQSLFLNRDLEVKDGKHQATKSLFNGDGAIDQSINPHDFIRNYRNMVEGHQDRNLKSVTQQVQSKGLERSKHTPKKSNPLEKLEITEIDDLLQLIDGCVEEANDYIGYLSDKIELLKSENSSMRDEQARILKVHLNQIQLKDGMIVQKQREIDRLRRELHSLPRPEPDKSFEIKKLLEVIDKITEENNHMKLKLRDYELPPRQEKSYTDKDKKDIYNEIHNKIDILNISIDKKQQEVERSESEVRDGKKGKVKNRFYR